MIQRLGAFFTALAVLIGAFVVGGIGLAILSLFGDFLYAAGLWPLGALIRISLLISVLGWALTLLFLAGMVLAAPFRAPEEAS